MPIKLKKTTSASALYGNSVLFNGSSQYLTTAATAQTTFGTNNFTIEFWIKTTTTTTNCGFLQDNSIYSATSNWLVMLNLVGNSGRFTFWNANNILIDVTGTVLNNNAWHHVAIVRTSTTNVTIFVDGTSIGSATISSGLTFGTGNGIMLGAQNGSVGSRDYTGYISNLRIVNGTAVYTSTFTPPTSPLTVISNTVLLMCQSATIIDNSTNNFTITNNGGATVSSAITPFSASLAYGGTNFKKNIYPRVGRSVQFNGSSQYLSLANNAAFNLTGDFTIESWFYVNSGTGGGIVGIGTVDLNVTTLRVYLGKIQFWVIGTSNYGQGTTTIVNGTWYHVAVVRSGTGTNNCKCYLNGVLECQITDNSTPSSSALVVGRDYPTLSEDYFPGYLSNFRVVKGTAVYTASFTPSTSPLTAISGTSLLTCQSPTIIDNSSNNFTITNNNTAVVSTTNPFGADTTGGGMGMKKSVVLFGTQKAIFGYGISSVDVSITNLVSNAGVVATDTTGVGTARHGLAAAGYGGDKAIFGYGYTSTVLSMTNIVSNTGVVANDTTGVGTARTNLAAAGYGGDKAIFGYGGPVNAITNKVSNVGVVASDTTGVGTARQQLAATGYGSDKAIFGYGNNGSNVSMTNLVSNTGVVATDTAGVGTARCVLAATGYGTDKAIFGYGYNGSGLSMTNLISNTGVVSTDTTGVGTARFWVAASGYGSDKAIFGYGTTGTVTAITNKVSNTGVVANDTTGVGTAREELAAAGFSLT